LSTAANKAFRMLSLAFMSGKAFHAVFISSPDADEALSLARRAASLCILGRDDENAVTQNPDYYFFAGEETGVNEIRPIIEELSKAAPGGGMRAIVISNAHAMTRGAQNTILKTLEEPPKDVIFLLSGHAEGMLSTIVSRCALVRLGQAGRAEIEAELIKRGVAQSDARIYAGISGGIMGTAIKLSENEDFRAQRDRSIAAIIALFNGELQANAGKAIAKAGAADGITFMLSFMGDILSQSMGGIRPIDNEDKQDTVRKIASRFTTRQILCIINKITKAGEGLYRAEGGTMYPAAVLDGLFLSILKELSK
jgi:DNA polymerase III delta prime subunit